MFCSLFCYNGFAQQNWYQMMMDHNANFKDVQTAFYDWYSTNKSNEATTKAKSGEENEEDGNYMLFKRWEWFMHARTYPSGKMPDPAVLEKEYNDFLNNNNKNINK